MTGPRGWGRLNAGTWSWAPVADRGAARPISPGQVIGLVLGLVALVVLQVSLISLLPTPLATPDLVLVTVAALGLARGPLVGGLSGAWAGWLLDLAPPAAGPLGGWTVVLAIVGYVVGRIAQAMRPGPVAAMVLVGLGCAGAVLARAAVLWFSGYPIGPGIAALAAGTAVWGLVLAPLALLVVSPRPGQPSAPVRTVPTELGAP